MGNEEGEEEVMGRGVGRRRGGSQAGLTCIALAISCSDACSPSAPEPSPRMFNMILHQSPTKPGVSASPKQMQHGCCSSHRTLNSHRKTVTADC